MTGSGPLAGARIRRVDAPAGDLVALSIAYGAERGVLLIALGGRPEIGLHETRPQGEPADAFVRKLRKELEGGTLRELTEPQPGLIHLVIARAGVSTQLFAELLPTRTNLVLVDADEAIVVARDLRALQARGLRPKGRYTPPPPAPRAILASSIEELQRIGERLLARRKTEGAADARRVFAQEIARARKKIERRRSAVQGDAARADEAPVLRKTASLILAHLQQIAPGVRETTLTDWESDPPQPITIEIDPAVPAAVHAERLFHRARRLDRGVTIARERRAQAEAELAELAELERALEEATSDAEIAILRERARRLLPTKRDRTAGSTKREPSRRLPYRTYDGTGGRAILVGRGAADNDALTLHHARPQDLWLHARGYRGAHVIVPLAKGETCPPDLLVDAATLAAHFSDARGEPTVDVQHCPRRHLRKPKGAAVGAVLVDREKVISVRLEPERLARLLATDALRE